MGLISNIGEGLDVARLHEKVFKNILKDLKELRTDVFCNKKVLNDINLENEVGLESIIST